MARSRQSRSRPRLKSYTFPGRATGVVARSATEARRRKTRPKSDRIVSWRYVKPGETKGGKWSRLRPDGKQPGKSRYTRRGLGPKPKGKKS